MTPEEAEKILDDAEMSLGDAEAIANEVLGGKPKTPILDPRQATYDNPVARWLAPAESIAAPLAAGFADISTLGAARFLPGFKESLESLKARSPRAVTTGGLAPGAIQIAANPATATGRLALNTAVPGVTTYAETEDPQKALLAGLTGFMLGGAGEALPYLQKGAGKLAESEAARSLGLTKGNIRRLGPTPSKMLERRLELGRSALDEGLVSPFKGTDELALLAEQKVKEAGEPIGEIIRTLSEAGETSGMTGPEIEAYLRSHLAEYLERPIMEAERSGADQVIREVASKNPTRTVTKTGMKPEVTKYAQEREMVIPKTILRRKAQTEPDVISLDIEQDLPTYDPRAGEAYFKERMLKGETGEFGERLETDPDIVSLPEARVSTTQTPTGGAFSFEKTTPERVTTTREIREMQEMVPYQYTVTEPRPYSLQELQSLKQDVGGVAYPTGPSGIKVVSGQSGYKGLQSGYTGIKDLQEQTLESAVQRNPSLVDFDNYLKSKKRYGDLQEIERYLSDAASADLSKSVVPLKPAIGGAAEMAGGGLPAAAATTVGLTAAQKTFHPAAALMLDKMEKIMGSKYGQMARETLKRGPKAFVSMDFMLQQTDPEYRKLLGITEAK